MSKPVRSGVLSVGNAEESLVGLRVTISTTIKTRGGEQGSHSCGPTPLSGSEFVEATKLNTSKATLVVESPPHWHAGDSMM